MRDGITFQIVLAAIGCLLGAGGLTALFRLGPKRDDIAFKTAEDAMVVQAKIINELRNETARLREEFGPQDAREVQIDDHWSVAFQPTVPAIESGYESVLIHDPDWRKN